MSIEAISWALNGAPIPRERRDASSLAVVLVGLANHADPDGRNAFPALSTLTRYTRLSERSVRYALRSLEELALIRPSDPDIVAAYVKRSDRRPNGYDLAVHRRESSVDNSGHEGQSLPPADQHGGQAAHVRGARKGATGGSACPRTVLNRQGTVQRERAPEGARAGDNPALPSVCGQCDARPSDPVSARVIWLDADHTRSQRCPRCHPAAAGGAR